LRGVAKFGVFGTAFYFAYVYGMEFSRATASPFWFPDSVLLCALLSTRRSSWPYLLAATVPIRLLVPAASDTPVWFLAASTAIDCAKAVLAATLLRRVLTNPMRFRTVREFGAYCVVAVILVPAMAALAGAAARLPLDDHFFSSWERWFLGDALASLIVTPFLFYWVLSPSWRKLQQTSGLRRAEAALLLCGLLASTWLAFEPSSARLSLVDSRFYAPVAFLVWAALRFGVRGASGALAILAVFAVHAALSQAGTFAGDTPGAIAASMQQFLFLRAVPLYLVAVLIDGGRWAEESLRESERRFRSLADTAPVLVWMAGPDKSCDFFNKGWLDFTGRSLAEECGNECFQGVHPDDREQCRRIYTSSFDHRQTYEAEYRLRRHDGEYRWILDRGVPRYSPSGEFLGYIGSAIDVTDRRLHAAALQRSEERYREVVEAQTDFVCRFLPDTTLTFVNEACCKFFRTTKEGLLSTPFLSLFPTNVRSSIVERLARTASSKEASEWECEVHLADGRVASIRWTWRPIFDGAGRVHEFQAIGHDVTDRKRAEEADRKLAHAARLATLGELTAVVAHEINQPLGAILRNAEAADLLLQNATPPVAELRQIVKDISKDDLRAAEAIQLIRTLTHRSAPEIHAVDLNEAVAGVLRLVSGDALRRHVQLRHDLARNLPRVLADVPAIGQVLLNLIVNGMDAMSDTPEDRRQITVTTAPAFGGNVIIAVADRGHGISSEAMSRLFESFFTTKPEGLGLGLSMAQSIVQAHRGRIWAENSAEGGAVFYVTLRAMAA
jgi:PAS domain S-box-containing protein